MASLTSLSGTVHFYTELSFSMWLESEAAHTRKSRETNSSLRPDGSTSSAPELNKSMLTVEEKRLDGYTIAEWTACARRKALIASHICKINGLLKAKVTADRRSLPVELNARTGGACQTSASHDSDDLI